MFVTEGTDGQIPYQQVKKKNNCVKIQELKMSFLYLLHFDRVTKYIYIKKAISTMESH